MGASCPGREWHNSPGALELLESAQSLGIAYSRLDIPRSLIVLFLSVFLLCFIMKGFIFINIKTEKIAHWGLPWWLSGKESACQCGRQGFATWSRKIPHTEEHGPQLLSLCSRAGKAQQSSPCAATTEVHASYSLCATREATAMRSLCIATKSSP